jgi:bifunctional non-homologous end joining protein LigD
MGCRAVLDGEIVSLDETGRPHFYDLLWRRGSPVFYAFDMLWLDGRDLRDEPLIEGKRILEQLAGGHPRILIAKHIEGQGQGTGLFRAVCENFLEGIVAKWKDGRYGETWFKILNQNYSQRAGWDELFKPRSAVA